MERPDGLSIFDLDTRPLGEVEIYCRFKDCLDRLKYSETSKLKHYKMTHKVEFPTATRGHKKAKQLREEEEYIEQLAREASEYAEGMKQSNQVIVEKVVEVEKPRASVVDKSTQTDL